MKNTKYKCAIFDLDGTLLYTLSSINKAINETLTQFGYPTHPLEKTVGFINFGSVELVRRALPEEKRTEEYVMRVHEVYAPLLKKYSSFGTHPYDGIIEVCKELKEKGIILCVMSNKPQSSAEACIDTYFEKGLFDIVRGSVPGQFIKPDKKFSLDVINQSKAFVNECIFIGDSIVDLESAKNVGCPCIWVKWGYGTEDNIGYTPDYIAEKPSDIQSIILGE